TVLSPPFGGEWYFPHRLFFIHSSSNASRFF
ncbi:hypothetical protein M2451_003903, partial [Dysgonomonas sp. PFB1-18]|nr:hypothetical protein [Dysgonomonas sp. PFB1-18]